VRRRNLHSFLERPKCDPKILLISVCIRVCLCIYVECFSFQLLKQMVDLQKPLNENHVAVEYPDRLCGLVVRVSGYRYRGLGFDPRRYQIF
jgi:hypothetical protein